MTLAQRIVLVLFAVSLASSVATGNQLYYRLTYFWGLLFFFSWIWAFFSLRGIRFERTARTLRAQVGQIFEERFEIYNESRIFRLWLEVRNDSTLPEPGGSQVLSLIGGRQRRIFWAQTLLRKRGHFPLGPTTIISGDLFGLFKVQHSTPAHESLLVYPMMVNVNQFPDPPGLLPGGEALRRRTPQVTPNASGVREYFPGDPLNRIHWTSTARRDRLMVKEFELDPLSEVWMFLDMGQYGHSALPEPPPDYNVTSYWTKMAKITLSPSTEEYSISITASLSRYFLRKGRAVGLVSMGQHLTLLPPDRGSRQLGKILESLAVLHAQGSLPLSGLVETQTKHVPRGSCVILITPTVMIEFAFMVEFLLRRGLRPIVVLLDPSTFGGVVSNAKLVEQIHLLGVPVRHVVNGADLESVLSTGVTEKLGAKWIMV